MFKVLIEFKNNLENDIILEEKVVGQLKSHNKKDGIAFLDSDDEYEKNLSYFIRDVRKDLHAPLLPFVIAETGMSGPEEKHPRALSLMAAQAAVAKKKEFKGNVAFVETKNFYRPPEVSPSRQGYHWNNNAETYFLIGEGMGKAMLSLLDN